MENEKFSLTEKKFRQINYLVISLIKQLLTQNFFVNIEREFLEFPHWYWFNKILLSNYTHFFLFPHCTLPILSFHKPHNLKIFKTYLYESKPCRKFSYKLENRICRVKIWNWKAQFRDLKTFSKLTMFCIPIFNTYFKRVRHFFPLQKKSTNINRLKWYFYDSKFLYNNLVVNLYLF